MKKFKKGDEVIVIAGADKGKTGKIISLKDGRVFVSGVNVKTLHKRPTQQEPGKIVKEERSIHISNISHVEDGKAVKVGFKLEEGEGKAFKRKVRISKKTNKKIAN